MIISQGIGWLVIVVTLGCLFATEYFTEELFQDDLYYQANGWPKMAGFLVAALVLHVIALQRSKRTARHLLDLETGEEVVLENDDSLFFIPLRYWSIICVVIGVAILFADSDAVNMQE